MRPRAGGKAGPGRVGVLSVVLVCGLVLGITGAGPVAATEPPPDLTDNRTILQTEQPRFSDISQAREHRLNVETLAERGILEGTECEPGKFCPTQPIPRWVMAVWLVRSVDGAEPPPTETTRFTDVDTQQWWMPYVERLADLGITKGCSTQPVQFCPTNPVTRQEMASFLVRAFRLETVDGNKFADVAEGNTHLSDINALAAAGVTAGCATDPDRYCPGRRTTRAEMATFLARALGVDRTPAPEEVTTPPVEQKPPPKEGYLTAISAGSSHTCGLLTDGTITCWIVNNSGQAEPPEGTFTAISAGSSRAGNSHTCGLLADGTITCWGANDSGQAEPPEGTFTAITSGWAFSCALDTEGSATCWGDGASDQTTAPEGPFNSISAGAWHVCGIRSDNSVDCWGDNRRGQAVAPPGEFTALASGSSHTCGLQTDGAITCWGNDQIQADLPTGDFVSLVSGDAHLCALNTDQAARCWGDNREGQGNAPGRVFTHLAGGRLHSCGIQTNQTITCWGSDSYGQSRAPDGKFSAVTAGRDHSCGLLTSGAVICWGRDAFYHAAQPQEEFIDLASGRSHSCGIRTDRTVACWGTNNHGQIHSPDGEFTAISVGAFHSCGIRTDHTVACWGRDSADQSSPPPGEFTDIAGGESHSCGITTDRIISCWGTNRNGQTDAPTGEFIEVTAGYRHSCAIRTDKTVHCWGAAWHFSTGGVPRGETDAPGGEFEQIAAGEYHTCGLRTDGTLACWGDNRESQSDPPQGKFSAVTSGRSYSCGLRTDQTATCWGRNLVVPDPVGVRHFNSWDYADPKMCRPPGVANDITAGFPLPVWAVPSSGTIKVAVLFVDFPNAVATHSPHEEAARGLPYIRNYLKEQSYGKFDPQLVPLHRWLRAEHDYQHYLETSTTGNLRVGLQIKDEAVRLADPHFDFTNHDAVMIVMPSSHFRGGTAGRSVQTEEGPIGATTLVNAFPLEEPRAPTQWGLLGTHELVHNLGLVDLYPYDASRHQPPHPPAGVWVRTLFGPMLLRAIFPASTDDPRLAYRILSPNGQTSTRYIQRLRATEMLSWSRWQLGWLEPTQIHCITRLETETTITISPVAFPGNQPAMVAIPTSETEVIVIESRRKLGYDAGREHQWPSGARTTFPSLFNEGVLVYTVNASLRSGRVPIVVAGDPGNGHFEKDPILTEGESVTIGNYTITVTMTAHDTDTITITRTGGP